MKYIMVFVCLFTVALANCNSATAFDNNQSVSSFTGRVKFPLYTNNVVKLTEFYRNVLGFEFLGYWDYNKNGYVYEWSNQSPPIYAGFKAADQKFSLHKATDTQQEKSIGAGAYYFEVTDVLAEYNRIKQNGANISPIRDTPGLKMFFVTDPDGRKIYFAANQKTSTQDLF